MDCLSGGQSRRVHDLQPVGCTFLCYASPAESVGPPAVSRRPPSAPLSGSAMRVPIAPFACSVSSPDGSSRRISSALARTSSHGSPVPALAARAADVQVRELLPWFAIADLEQSRVEGSGPSYAVRSPGPMTLPRDLRWTNVRRSDLNDTIGIALRHDRR